MFIGSEGNPGRDFASLDAIAAASKLPRRRIVRFPSFFDAARAVRAVAQAGLYRQIVASWTRRRPSTPARRTAVLPSWCSAFESGDHPLDPWMARALECCADHCGTPEPAKASDAHLQGAAGIWRNAFIRMPMRANF